MRELIGVVMDATPRRGESSLAHGMQLDVGNVSSSKRARPGIVKMRATDGPDQCEGIPCDRAIAYAQPVPVGEMDLAACRDGARAGCGA